MRKIQCNDWKVTVAFANDDFPEEAGEGGRYVVHLNRPIGNHQQVADLVLRDVVHGQLTFAPDRNMDFITVAVWSTEGTRPVMLAAASAVFHTSDGLYEYAGTTQEIDAAPIPGERVASNYEEWEKP